jgi:hypothetical protein
VSSLAYTPAADDYARDDEAWWDIPGFPDYQASDRGRIRSHKRGAWQVLRQTPHRRNGYMVVSPRVGGRYVTRSVHRLIAITFLGSADGRDVNHMNGNKHDNRLANLEYLSRGENHRHAYRTGLRDAVGRKLTDSQVREIAALRGFATQAEIARQFGVCRALVGRIHKRERYALLSA